MNLNRPDMRISDSHFGMIPRAEIPRSTFVTTHTHKTMFDGGYLIPVLVEEVLPGDSWQGEMTIFARLNTLLYPIMDYLCLESFFFFCPNRILWDNWRKIQGERDDPADSISYTIPQVVSGAGGFVVGSVYDYMGLPTVGQVATGATVSVNVLPLRAYRLIYDQWFRDQNLNPYGGISKGNGPDLLTDYFLQRRNKKPDYFTTALPSPQKGSTDITLPLSGTAPVKGIAFLNTATPSGGNPPNYDEYGGVAASGWAGFYPTSSANVAVMRTSGTGSGADPVITADLSQATGATINALRLAIQTQRLLERDARGGTRYTESLHSHWGIIPQDARLQRPEYIGGGKSDFQTSAIPQTSATSVTGSTTPVGSLAAQSLVNGRHTFTYHAPEHGWIIGLVQVRAELTYQQGLPRKWTRLTRYDHYIPVFANLGEQAIRNDEIYCLGAGGTSDGADGLTFGYQERWSEYRYRPGLITGLMRSTTTPNVDEWHLSQQFSSRPALNSTFMADTPPLSRVLAGGAGVNGQQIIFDSLFKIKNTRLMPMFSVPGMMDHL